MNNPSIPTDPAPRSLIKATVLALLVALVLLVTVVMPAEYGIDPTGIGARLGLNALAEIDAEPEASPAADSADETSARNAAEAAKAASAFGASDKQSFATQAVSARASSELPKQESLTVTLPPGKGVEVKALLSQGDGMVFRWTANAEVAVDMHGERPEVKGPWTSYSVEAAQREGAGTFIAPFDGTHGWYWENRSAEPVEVRIDVSGFQQALYQP